MKTKIKLNYNKDDVKRAYLYPVTPCVQELLKTKTGHKFIVVHTDSENVLAFEAMEKLLQMEILSRPFDDLEVMKDIQREIDEIRTAKELLKVYHDLETSGEEEDLMVSNILKSLMAKKPK